MESLIGRVNTRGVERASVLCSRATFTLAVETTASSAGENFTAIFIENGRYQVIRAICSGEEN